MKKEARFIKAFGENEYGTADLPKKISNIAISRINNFDIMGGCSFCYPHGYETSNSHYKNMQKNWKKYKAKQYYK